MRTLAPVAVVALLFAATLPAQPQSANKVSDGVVKLGLIEDMSGLYADITGMGSVTAAKMAVEDFGGKVLGAPIEVLSADHQNKADIASATARQWFDTQQVDALLDVAASATALAAIDVAKAKHKIIILNGPGAVRITNEACTSVSVHYAYDNYALSHGTGEAMVKAGYDTWFFITADYAFGHDLEQNTADVVTAHGGKVLGQVKVPLNTSDFSSALLQAQASGAKVIGLANAGGDTINSIKQAAEFGIVRGGQKLAGLLVFINDVNSLGLQAAQGMLLTNAFYWDRDDASRAWSQRFLRRVNKMPNMAQAGVYSSTLHYLQAIADAGTDETSAVVEKMKATPINDFFARNGQIRVDGRMMHDMYLYEVKSPSESKGPWDFYKPVATIPADEAFMPLSQSRCPLAKR
ncbi:MAG TPA: ABC transporter substrate-binding protein [Xanthobacteraceae bacterium]|nr:ABC transporter substrate-binding protein [Xanthobacteraceae bacterium]